MSDPILVTPQIWNAETYVVRTRLKPQLCGGEGRWTADYVRLRFEARLTN
jgi:hypothetical protein